MFSEFWSAYPIDRTESFELGGHFYNGTGGIDVMPPLAWMFEPNFILSDTTMPIHVMRYKDIHERMEFLYPYFVYEFSFGGTPNNPQFEKIEASIVTDGTNTYWLMPLVVALDASHVPWSSPRPLNFMLNLIGFALVDAYNGTVQVLVTGNDCFSKIFLEQYKHREVTIEVPAWLQQQIKYPQEMFVWQISKFGRYHITDPKLHLEGRDIYTVPTDSSSEELLPYYAIAQPHGFREPAFVGQQYLQPNDSDLQNLVGYMVVENNLESLGQMTFYSVPSNSSFKLIGPGTARTTLINDQEYKNISEELKRRNSTIAPAVGDSILYKIGDHEMYFIPVMINDGEKVGIVGAVGALLREGTNYVGLGRTPADAFQNYLQKLFSVPARENPPVPSNQSTQEKLTKIQQLEMVFAEAGLTVVKPTAIYAPLEFEEIQLGYTTDSDFAQSKAAVQAFIERFMPANGRVFEWENGTSINFGILVEVDGIVENHYISIQVGNQVDSVGS